MRPGPRSPSEASTEFDLDAASEPGVVECYIGVEAAAAVEVARRLAAVGIAVATDRVADGEATASRRRRCTGSACRSPTSAGP